MLIFLVGYMGCGKSTIGRKLSSRLGWRLIDTDHFVEQRAGLTIAQMFEKFGEEHFRELEREALEALIECGEDCIVSTGGGLPVWRDNMEVMSGAGVTVYLCRTAENIASRLSAVGRAKRPKLRGLSDDELIEYMNENIALRDPIYRRSTLVIDAVPLGDGRILDRIIKFVNGQEE
ncbi:MAG: shikimate kinase [Rikenellaceae bacterium]